MPFPAPPPWQASLQPALIRRLTRPLGRSGLINSQMGQTILRRATRLNQRLPLLDHQMQRWSKVVDLEAPPLPIVYVQPRSPAELSGPAMAPSSVVSPEPSLLHPPKPGGDRQEASSVEDLELRSPTSPIDPANVGPGPMAPPPPPPGPLGASPGDQTWPSNPSQSAATSAMAPPPAPDLVTPAPPPGLTAVQSHGGLPAPDDGNPMPGFNPLGVAAPALSPLTLGNLPTPGVIQRRSEVSAEANGWPSSAIATLPTVALPSPGLISDQPGSAAPALSPTSIPSPEPLALSLPWPAETFSSSPLATPDLPNGANEAPGITPLGVAPLPLATLPAPGVIQRRSEEPAGAHGWPSSAIAALPTVAPPTPEALASSQAGIPSLATLSLPLTSPVPWPVAAISSSPLAPPSLPKGDDEAPGLTALGVAPLPLTTLPAPGVIQRRSEESAGANGWPSSALPTVALPSPGLISNQPGSAAPALSPTSIPSPEPLALQLVSSLPWLPEEIVTPPPLGSLPSLGVIQRRLDPPTAPGLSDPISFSSALVVGSSPPTEARPGIPASLPWGFAPLALPVSGFDVDNLPRHQNPEGSERPTTPPLQGARTEQRRSLPLGFGPGPKPLAKPKQRLLPNQPPKITFRRTRSTPPLQAGGASHQSGDLPLGLVPTLISSGPEARANGQPTVMVDQPATAVFASLPPLTPTPGPERHDRSSGVSGAATLLKAFALPPSPPPPAPTSLTGAPDLSNLATARSVAAPPVTEGISPPQLSQTQVEVPWSISPLPALPLPLVSLVQDRSSQGQPNPSTRQVEEPTSPATVRTATSTLAAPATASGTGALEAQTDWGTQASSQPIAAHLDMEALLETVERRLIKRLIVESERRGKSKWP